MIKLSASLSKKVPVPGIEYSSQQFGASLEIEVSDADKPEAIQQRMASLYALLSNTIDQQLQTAATGSVQPANGTTPTTPRQLPTNGRSTATGNASRSVMATQAQQRAIHALSKALNLDIAGVLADHNVADVSQLTIKNASRLIDSLKSRQNGNGARQ